MELREMTITVTARDIATGSYIPKLNAVLKMINGSSSEQPASDQPNSEQPQSGDEYKYPFMENCFYQAGTLFDNGGTINIAGDMRAYVARFSQPSLVEFTMPDAAANSGQFVIFASADDSYQDEFTTNKAAFVINQSNDGLTVKFDGDAASAMHLSAQPGDVFEILFKSDGGGYIKNRTSAEKFDFGLLTGIPGLPPYLFAVAVKSPDSDLAPSLTIKVK